MDYNFWGLKPTGDDGERFQASGCEYLLLVGYCQQVAPELVSEEWRTKGLHAAGTLALAEALETEINANQTDDYAREGASKHGVMFSTENIAAFAAFLRGSGGFVVGVTTLDEKSEAWLAIRKEAAKAINPATAIVMWDYGQIFDPYDIYPDLPDECDCIGRNYYARAPLSEVWVSFHDLPKSVVKELWRRRNDPDGPWPSDDDDELPFVNRLVAKIMARDSYESGYAAAVAGGIAAKLATCAPP
jgi:hypothetical protein